MAGMIYTLRELHVDLCSCIAETRGRAMSRLLLWLEKDRTIGPAVLPMFRVAVDGETDAWTATSAIRGMELLLGFEASKESWRTLFARPDAVFVSRLALAADRPEHVPMLLQLLADRREIPIRASVLRTIGRSKGEGVFEAIAAEATEPAMRQAMISALGDLGDPRGIPLAEPFLTDTTPSDQQDERGARLWVGDLARDAIMMMKRNLVPSPGNPGEG